METLIGDVLTYLVRVIVATISQLFILLGPCLFLTFLMSILARSVQRLACQCMGISAYLGLFGWLGTSVHELGHVVFHLLFGHRIVEVKLFAPDHRTGTLGYVRSMYQPHSLYQRIGIFFSGIGPILFGTLVIYVAYLLLVQPTINYANQQSTYRYTSGASEATISTFVTDVSQSSAAILGSLFNPINLLNWKFYLFVYLTFAVGSSIHLSGSDIDGAITGFTTVVIFLLLFNLGTIWLGNFASNYFLYFSQFYGFFYAMMIFVLVMNLLALAILSVVRECTRTR